MAAVRSSLLIGILCLLLPASRALAVTAIVPDQYPTIQAAINSGADVVQVKAGDYDERLDFYHHSVASFEAYRAAYNDTYNASAFPRVRGIVDMPSMAVRGIHFLGAVRAGDVTTVQFDDCRFDSSFTTPHNEFSYLRLHGCQVFGGWSGHAIGGFEFNGCTFVGGGLNVSTEGWGYVRSCYVSGPAATGIKVDSWEARLFVEHNTVERTTDGIAVYASGPYQEQVVGNEVRDCTGTAFRVEGGGGTPSSVLLKDNRALRCQGQGIDAFGTFGSISATGNTIDSVGSDGIRVECTWTGPTDALSLTGNRIGRAVGSGVWVQRKTGAVPQSLIQNNVVLNSTSDGVRTELGGSVIGNVVGRSGGHGLSASTTALGKVRSNTFYLNNGSGILMPAVASDTVDHNIAYGNHRYGLESAGQPIQAKLCNDWYLNALGAAGGTTVGTTDLQVDPRFCNLQRDSVSLGADSPLAAAPGCGRIGALGVGCTQPTTAVEPGMYPRDHQGFTATPLPARGSVRLSWQPLGRPARVEIYDTSGARRWEHRIEPGRGELEWEPRTDEGVVLPAGIYFARLIGEESNAVTRIVLVR